jgi:hypothetical protein
MRVLAEIDMPDYGNFIPGDGVITFGTVQPVMSGGR